MSFGVGSLNISREELRGLWNWKDLSTGERIGYLLGDMANVRDIGTRGDRLVNVEKNDLINHAAIKDINGSTIISFGHGDSPKYDYLLDNKTGVIPSGKRYGKLLFGVRGSNDYLIHGRDILLKGVNTTVIKGYGTILTYLSHKGLIPYSFIYSSCSTHVGLAFWFSGVPNLFIHPYALQVSVWLWNHGITSYLIQNSYHLIINKQR